MQSVSAGFALLFFCLPMSSPMKLHSGSASTGFLLHNSGKSRSVSNVMFHLMYVMLGRKLILLEENRNPVSLWSEIFRCIEVLHLIPVCIWMLEFLS